MSSLLSMRAVYQCQGEQEAARPHYQAPHRLFLTEMLSMNVFVCCGYLSRGHSCLSDPSVACDHDREQDTADQNLLDGTKVDNLPWNPPDWGV